MIDLNGSEAVSFIVGVSVILAAVLVGATVYDLRHASRMQRERLVIIEKLFERPMTSEQYTALLAAMARPASGIQGLTRSLLALSILLALVLSLAALFTSTAAGATEMLQNLVSGLLSLFATIVGFYFGSRTAQTSAEGGARRADEAAATVTASRT